MKNDGCFVALAFLLFIAFKGSAQDHLPPTPASPPAYKSDWVNKYWEASWISAPGKTGREYGVYHFRKSIQIKKNPDSFLVNISADNRYRLFVNGKIVGAGPAQGTPGNWFYDTYDLAPFLQPGENIIACQVWNYGEHIPWVQMSVKTAFIIQGNSEREKQVNTNQSWKVIEDKAYSVLPIDPFQVREFIIVTPGDSIDGRQIPWGWEEPSYKDSSWKNAINLVRGAPYATGTDLWWQLVPRSVPYLKEDTIRFRTIRRITGMDTANTGTVTPDFLSGTQDMILPAFSKTKIIVDQGVEMTAFPEIRTSEGKGAVLTLRYAEAMMDSVRLKGNRNDIRGKTLYGVADKFITDGGDQRLFRPLWFRSYRFVELEVVTKSDPLVIHDLYGKYNHVERPLQASFETSDSLFNRILHTAWHTQDVCTKDYLLTDAYYEQLQYIGDNRIQALILNSMGYDRELVKNMIRQYFQSRTSEGLTQSRFPCAVPQIIPTYSLLWINILHDYWTYYSDDAFIRQMLSGVNSVLDWYEQKLDPLTGMLGKTEFFNFVDWTKEWAWDNNTALGGIPAGCSEGGSSITSMQLAYALRDAAELFTWAHNSYFAEKYKVLADRISKNVWRRCWDAKRQLLSDTPDKLYFSQHANIFGVLSHTIPLEQQRSVIRRIATDTSLVQTSLYFRFYLGQAYKAAGLAEEYLDLMGPWKTMLEDGLTTFAEVPGNAARSDCHPWSCSPLYEFYSTICGIRPRSPGFSKIEIKPALGALKWVRATMIHDGQPLRLSLKRRNGLKGIEGEVFLPGKLEGVFVWKGKEVSLHKGQNIIRL
ncbi:family 78 glycoside hydrolase catalytic domain [Flavitalea flava]